MGCGTIIIRHGTIERIATVAESRRLADSWLTASNVAIPHSIPGLPGHRHTHTHTHPAGWNGMAFSGIDLAERVAHRVP